MSRLADLDLDPWWEGWTIPPSGKYHKKSTALGEDSLSLLDLGDRQPHHRARDGGDFLLALPRRGCGCGKTHRLQRRGQRGGQNECRPIHLDAHCRDLRGRVVSAAKAMAEEPLGRQNAEELKEEKAAVTTAPAAGGADLDVRIQFLVASGGVRV
jgi:hypothetical protein